MHFATRKIALLALGALGMFATVSFAAAAETAVRDPKILTALRQTPLLVMKKPLKLNVYSKRVGSHDSFFCLRFFG